MLLTAWYLHPAFIIGCVLLFIILFAICYAAAFARSCAHEIDEKVMQPFYKMSKATTEDSLEITVVLNKFGTRTLCALCNKAKEAAGSEVEHMLNDMFNDMFTTLYEDEDIKWTVQTDTTINKDSLSVNAYGIKRLITEDSECMD